MRLIRDILETILVVVVAIISYFVFMLIAILGGAVVAVVICSPFLLAVWLILQLLGVHV